MAEPLHAAGELGNQRNEEQRNKAIKLAHAVAEEGLRWILGDARGRAFVWAQLEKARIFAPSFHADPAVMAFNEGRRSTGLELLAELERRRCGRGWGVGGRGVSRHGSRVFPTQTEAYPAFLR